MKKSEKLEKLLRKIVTLLMEYPDTAFSYRELHRKLNTDRYNLDDVKEAADYLLESRQVRRENNRFMLNPVIHKRRDKRQDGNDRRQGGGNRHGGDRKRYDDEEGNDNRRGGGQVIEGVVDVIQSGAAYIISEHSKRDIYVPANRLKRAIDGDRVRVKVLPPRGRRLEGEVIEILEHTQTHFVGILALSKRTAFLIPDKKMGMDLFIPQNRLKNAEDGQKVLVRVVEWPDEDKKNPVAEVVAVLGNPGENDAEMLSILVDNGFPLTFSEATQLQADTIRASIPASEIKRRRDFRDILTLTIDPADAKDFDDAISLRRLDNGNWEVGVHIADVAHYLPVDSPMDQDGLLRATSVYLVDRVLPMLPEKLSNEVCSLRPREEKLCFSAVFELTEDAELINEWFGRTVIYSDRRFNYSEAQQIIETGEGDLAEELRLLNKLAKKMRHQRLKNGSIDFGSEEVKFKLDEKGKPIDVYIKEIQDSNRLIEDFMLLANRRVAHFINHFEIDGKEVPSVNRIHDVPDNEKLMSFQKLAAGFGYRLDFDTPKKISQSLNKLLDEIQGKPEQHILENLAIRTMAKAAYSTRTEVGHYGLAFEDYTHFTSPIRRYPDVMTHRILAQCLAKKPRIEFELEDLERKCEHSSLMERKAMQAERESVKYKQVEYLSERIGEVFDGVISGAIQYGFFVELKENKCEGMVRLESLLDDHYEFDQASYAIIGTRKGKRYQMGMPVTVQVVRTDLATRTIDMEVVGGGRRGKQSLTNTVEQIIANDSGKSSRKQKVVEEVIAQNPPKRGSRKQQVDQEVSGDNAPKRGSRKQQATEEVSGENLPKRGSRKQPIAEEATTDNQPKQTSRKQQVSEDVNTDNAPKRGSKKQPIAEEATTDNQPKRTSRKPKAEGEATAENAPKRTSRKPKAADEPTADTVKKPRGGRKRKDDEVL